MSSSLFSSAPAAAQNQAISDYVGQVMSGNYTDQQRAQMISQQAAQMGVSNEQIAAATGYSPSVVNQYLSPSSYGQKYDSSSGYLVNADGSDPMDFYRNQVNRPGLDLGLGSVGGNPSRQQIDAAEQAARQAWMNMGMGPGYAQGVDPSVYQTLYSTNAQGQVVRNSDGYVAPFSMNSIQNPNAQQYYQQKPQELFALGALGGGGGQGYFQDAGVRGTNLKMGQLTPDQWYRGYTSNFADGWDQDTSNTYRWAGQNSQPVGQNKPSVGGGGVSVNPGQYSGGYGGASGGVYGGGSSSSSTTTGGQVGGLNPYLTQAQQAITQQATDNLNRNILPGISSTAQASGNYGGSRQGVVEANAIRDLNQQITNGMAGLSFNAYNSALNAGLQQQQIDNSYNLGLGNLGLGYQNANNSFYTAQRGQDLQSTALGAQLINQANQGYLSQGQGVYNVGNTYQTAPWSPIGNFNSTMSPWGSATGSVSGNQSSNPWASALGGALGASQLFKMF